MPGSKSNYLEAGILDLVLNGVPLGDLADDDAAAPLTVLEVSLHTADPGETGDQTTNEVAYTGYARVSVNRNAVTKKWTITAGAPSSAVNVDDVVWPACTGSTAQATWFEVGTAHSGAGHPLYAGQITTPSAGLSISVGITPKAPAGTLVITED